MTFPVIVFLFFALLWGIGAILSVCDREPSAKKVDKWFKKTPLHIREKATGIYRGKFSDSYNYEEFIYVTDIMWKSLSLREKRSIYIKFLPPKQSPKKCKSEYHSYGCE